MSSGFTLEAITEGRGPYNPTQELADTILTRADEEFENVKGDLHHAAISMQVESSVSCCQNSAYCPSPATRQTCSHTTRPVSSSSTSIVREARLETWHQGLADTVFSHRQHSFPGRVIAECLRTAGRHVSTWLGYAGKVKQWEDFCARTGVAPFPAQQAYLLCYLGHIQEEGTVKSSSLQPYLSTLNSWHADMGLPKPAVGQAITMLSSRYCEVQDDEDD